MTVRPDRAVRASTAGSTPPRVDPVVRLVGIVAITLLTVVVALTWLPLDVPFGDDHDGRTLVLNAIQVEQVRERGLLATDLGSSLAPYVEARSYAHHPPAMKVLYTLASFLPVSLEASTRLVSYGLGLLTLPALALLLRRLGVAWGGTVLGVAAVAAVPMFWAYGRIHGPLGATVLLVAVVADLRDREHVSPPRLAATCVLAAFVVASNWLALATAALLGLWLLQGRRRLDAVVVAVGLSMALAATVTLVWVLGVAGTEELAAQVDQRATTPGFTRAEWFDRVARWVDELVPLWWQVLAVLGLVGAAVARRVRVVALAALVLAVGWVVGLPGGSYVHDYWLLPLVLPVGLGLAGLAGLALDRARRTLPTGRTIESGVTAGAGVLGLAGVLALSSGSFGQQYETAPRDMAIAAAEAPPPDGQEVAWHGASIPGRLTVAWAWGRPAEPLTTQQLTTADDAEHVVVDLARPPAYVTDAAALRGSALAVEGDYAVVTVGALERQREGT